MSSFVIYNKETTRLIGGSLTPKMFNTERGAKAFMTRCLKRGAMDRGIKLIGRDNYAIADAKTFHDKIEKQDVSINLMSGKLFSQPVNTPLCCDPSSETYWSM